MELYWQRITNGSGHNTALSLLEKSCGSPLPPIQKTPRGKPCFADYPLHFSISHTDSHAFCCVHHRNVGIDAEQIGRKIDPRLFARYCSESEQLACQSASDPEDALLRLWVLKESYAKFTGRGLGNYLQSTHFSPDDERIRIIDGCYVAVYTEERSEQPCSLIPTPM